MPMVVLLPMAIAPHVKGVLVRHHQSHRVLMLLRRRDEFEATSCGVKV